MLLIHAVRSAGPERKRALTDLVAGAAWFYYWIVLGFVLLSTDFLIPRTYDQFLYAFDSSLGFQPSFLAGQFLSTSALFENLVYTLYFSIALPVALLYAAQIRRNYSLGYKIFPLLIAASLEDSSSISFCPPPDRSMNLPAVFLLCFRLSPRMSARSYPSTIGRAQWHAIFAFRYGPDAVVELQDMARRGAGMGVGILSGHAFATLATGQHYAIDLSSPFQ